MEATENFSTIEDHKTQTTSPEDHKTQTTSPEDHKTQTTSPEDHKTQTTPLEASTDDLYDVYKGFTKTSINVIQKAASILEEEVAAGIIAAKKVEEHFVDTNKLRYGRPEEVMSRLRLDAHEVVDIVIDLVNVAMKSMYNISQNVVRIRSSSSKTRSEHVVSGQLPVITTAQPIKAGYSCEIPLSLENSGDEPTEEFNLYCTELVSASGERILASQISFAPSSLKIDLHNAEKVMITINVPEETKPGVYSGLVSATNLSQIRSIILIKVG